MSDKTITIIGENVLWWEMLDWNQMRRAYNVLPKDTKELIRVKDLAPEKTLY